MKLLYITILVLAVTISSCSKSSNAVAVAKSATPAPEQHAATSPAPVARFTLGGVQDNAVKELVPLAIENLSENGDSYFWDFGDGNTSTLKTPDFNFNMHGQYTITLMVKNKAGMVTEYTSQPITVICCRSIH